LTYAQAKSELKPGRDTQVQITGNPVRQEFIDLLDQAHYDRVRSVFRDQLQIPQDAFVLLVFGGSQGARHINNAVLDLAPQLLQRPELQVIQITGPKEYAAVQQILESQAAKLEDPTAALSRWHLIDYCKQMTGAYSAADLIVSRAGASSLAEIATLGTPTLLIPYPFATNNHQQANAASLVEAGAAAMVLDADLDSQVFADTLFELIDNSESHVKMAIAAKALQAVNATETVTNLLIGIAQGKE
jgi:UDP-N-acetylglucosamine--N-acetylmuramyl-(pentapeptide) pyrophosphoryl-undecaprenol N-acetylglucosamine transferase